MRILILTTLLLTASCGGGNDAVSFSPSEAESTPLGCEDFQAVMTPDGILFNNVWNKHAAKAGEWSQCLQARDVAGTRQFGWSWNWPAGERERTIYAYPQIKRGPSPWAPELNSDERFPAGIAALRALEVSYEVETSASGNYNLATSLWITREPVRGAAAKPTAIAAEVMIWTYATSGHFDPAGSRYGEVQTGDTGWEVWVKKDWWDISGMNDNRWTYIVFRSTQPLLKAEIDVLKLLQYAVDERLISSEFFIADVELGNEIMEGSGETWVKSFHIDMN